MSFDSIAENKAFADKFSFPFKLLCDTDRKLGLAYGAANSAADQYAKRIAYVIEGGKITRAYDVKSASSHPSEVLNDIA